MTAVLFNELIKTFAKWRTYIGFIAIGVLVPLVEFGMKWEGPSMMRGTLRSMEQDFIITGNIFNGFFITQIIMNSLWVHVPFLISLVAGDVLAGEATGGTFRLMLIRPISRSRILFVKYLTTLLYTLTLVVFLGVVSLGLGVALFGTGDLVVAGGGMITIIPKGELWWRFVAAFGAATWSMWCVASLAFLFSSLVENSIGPIIGTMTVIIAFFILSNLPVEFFQNLSPYLFTSYLNVWHKFLEDPIPMTEIWTHLWRLAVFCIGFYGVTWYIFVRKDILS